MLQEMCMGESQVYCELHGGEREEVEREGEEQEQEGRRRKKKFLIAEADFCLLLRLSPSHNIIVPRLPQELQAETGSDGELRHYRTCSM